MAERQVRVAAVIDDSAAVAGAAGFSKATIQMGETATATATKVADAQLTQAEVTKKSTDQQIASLLRLSAVSKTKVANLSGDVLAGLPAGGIGPITERAAVAQGLLAKETAKTGRFYGQAARESKGYGRSLSETEGATKRLSTATKTAEVDLNKIVRGGLAGSGALSALGRSLAFASTGFIAFAVGATVIKSSIKAAQDEAVAQKQVAAQLKTSGKSFKEYGGQIDSVLLKESHLAGFTKAELLTAFGFLVRIGGNVQKSLHLTALAADVARARSISLQSASIALAKALGGSATALRRLGIIVPKNVSTTQALAFVTQKFAGQAEAGTTASEKFHATLVDTGAVIGKALLPTFNRLATSLSNWLAKMNETGRLQKNVNTIVSDTGRAFHDLEAVIKKVDDVTGSFKNTLEALLAFGFTRLAFGWGVALTGLATKWGLVADAATAAGAAQERALATGGAGAAAGAEGAAAGAGARGAVAGLSTVNIAAIVAAVSAVILNSSTYKRVQGQAKQDLGPLGFLVSNAKDLGHGFVNATRNASDALQSLVGWEKHVVTGLTDVRGQVQTSQPGGGRFIGSSGRGGAKPPPVLFKSFTDTIRNQLAQARAALTKGTQDDVKAAKAEIAQIKKEIAAGHLKGAALIQALQAEAGAINTIQSAEAAAAQKRAAKAQALKAKVLARIQASIDPLKLEVALSKDQADNAGNKKIIHDLKALRSAARKALASGKLSLAQQKEAYDQITQLNSQIAAATKKNNEATSKAGRAAYKQVNQAKFLGGLDLTPAQRKALRQRLAQLGPGGTVGSDRVGAYGYQIGDNGRPIHVHSPVYIDGKKVADNTTKHQRRRRRRNSSQRRGPAAGENG